MSLRQYGLGPLVVEPDELVLMRPPIQPLLPTPAGLSQDLESPQLELVPSYQTQIDRAQAERDEANRLSDWRAEIAPAVGTLVVAVESRRWSRLGAAAMLGRVWYSDHQDGVYARRSNARLKKIINEHPAAKKNEQIIRLQSYEVQTNGGERDQKADKKLTDEVNLGLLARATVAEDWAAAMTIAGTIQSNLVRNPIMAETRQNGLDHRVKINARGFGKFKTAILATGQIMMIGAKTGSVFNRMGLGLIGISNAASWAAIPQMKKYIKSQVAEAKSNTTTNINTVETYRQLLGNQYPIDLEGEPVEALRVA